MYDRIMCAVKYKSFKSFMMYTNGGRKLLGKSTIVAISNVVKMVYFIGMIEVSQIKNYKSIWNDERITVITAVTNTQRVINEH